MTYLIEPVNKSYDPVEPLPTPLGFVAKYHSYVEVDDYKRKLKPVPESLLSKTVEVTDQRSVPMPDFFFITYGDYFVSSRFRAVLDTFAAGAVEYFEMDFRIPPTKKPAEAYYFLNVLGRNQLIDWDVSPKRLRWGAFFCRRVFR